MLSLYITLPLLIIIALVQTLGLGQISILGGQADLVFLAAVMWAFLRGPAEGAVWAFIGGLLLDLFSGGPFGGIAFAIILTSLFVSRRWGQELGSTLLQLILLVLIACFAYHILSLVILGWTGYPVNWQYSLARVAAPSAVLNAILAPFVYWPLAWLDRRTRPEGFTLQGTY